MPPKSRSDRKAQRGPQSSASAATNNESSESGTIAEPESSAASLDDTKPDLPLVQVHQENPKKKKASHDGQEASDTATDKNEDMEDDEDDDGEDEGLMEDEFDVLAQETGAHESIPKAEQPDEMTTPLLPFQLESLYWMKRQEHSAYRGGVLADEMGMGKTLQAIGLFLSHRADTLSNEPLFGPPAHESEGVRKERQRREDEAAKEKKKRMRVKLRDARREARKQEKTQAQQAKKSRKSDKQENIPFPEKKTDEEIYQELSDEEIPVEPVETPPQVLPEQTAQMNDVISGGITLPKPQGNACNTTLVVCPVVALNQWKLEIERHTAPGSLKVLVYHGSNRSSSIDMVKSYDVVLTTYSIIENEFRRMIEPTKKVCEYCGRKLLPEKMTIHLRYFCGPDAQRTERLAMTERRATRVARRFARQTHRQLQSAVNENDEELSSSSDDEGDSKPKKPTKKSSQPATTSSASKKSGKGTVANKTGRKTSNKSIDSKEKAVGKKATGKKAASTGSKKRKRKQDSSSEDSEFSGESSGESDDENGGVPDSRPPTRHQQSGEGAATHKEGKQSEDTKHASEESDKHSVSQLGPISLLQSIFWKRVVLDEAHAIKNRRSTTAKAAFALTAERRWCLSGTPLQNRVGELYSLIRFLRIDPFAYYFCRNCPCKTLDYKFGSNWKSCDECGHSPLRHYCWWNRFISNPIRFHTGEEAVEKALNTLRSDVLTHILLRRTKTSRSSELSLPPKVTTIRVSPMDPFEQDFYEALYTQSQAKFNTYVQSGTILHNYAHIFDLLVRLRQAVDHPYLVLYSNSGGTQSAEEESSQNTTAVGPCGICNEACEDPVLTNCNHPFCRTCMRDFLSSFDLSAGELQCPKCFAPLTIDLRNDDPTQSLQTAENVNAADSATENTDSQTSQQLLNVNSRQTASLAALNAGADRVSDAYLSALGVLKSKSMLARLPPERIGKGFRSSSKIEALLEELYKARVNDPGGKSLVFSQFTNMLDLIQHRLSMAGVQAVRLDGRMSVKQRDRMVNAFMTDPDVTVFLVSLKAGGLALNLTAAHRIYLMDPWWNPAAEYQALDRTHRLGQYRPINAVRFMIKDSIEERIMALQEKKRLIFEGTVGQNEGELSKLTEKDMKFLFTRA